MGNRKAKHETEPPLGCWQVLGIALVVLIMFLLIYEPLINLAR